MDLYDAAHLAAWPVLALGLLLTFAGLEFIGLAHMGKPRLRYTLAGAAYLLAVTLLWVAYQLLTA